ncbi:putative beta-lysine N-acetyltransferase [Cellulosilyticum sp. I15G10I2]|uniref:putative beta-lysine N-acetyltransferase n=1 Tax=Cellulosilyticum sp. I15G10I2 TaxID=1892843 RepID=UPI00085BECDB|nr:putative beta-lysine N-acetyltransferase [Cellulosilyticum sp. I15G10I2]
MYDKVEEIGYSTIHHGPYNNRIYLMAYNDKDEDHITNWLDLLANNRGYSKIIAKLPHKIVPKFIQSGFTKEGEIQGYYKGCSTCFLLSKYLDANRLEVKDKLLIDNVIEVAKSKKYKDLPPLKPEFSIRQMTQADAENMAKVYQEVFETYPFPICDAEYIKQTMITHVKYFGVTYQGELIGLSSCEMNKEEQNVEMTDFAILPKARNYKLAKQLLHEMEKAMQEAQMKTFYTIARATSYAMNATFSSMGYSFGGTLYNNTQIAGQIESMNLWYKANSV